MNFVRVVREIGGVIRRLSLFMETMVGLVTMALRLLRLLVASIDLLVCVVCMTVLVTGFVQKLLGLPRVSCPKY